MEQLFSDRRCKKIFIQRDYTYGTAVRFSDEYPPDLCPKIDENTFRQTIAEINGIFAEAEALNCNAYSEGCISCLSGYTVQFFFKTRYEKCIERASQYIQSENSRIYEPTGIILGDPMDRGLRCIEVCIFDT
jgi:hypothetical protein